MLRAEDLLKNRTTLERKLFVVGASSDLAQLLDSILTDSQRKTVIEAVDSWLTQEEQDNMIVSLAQMICFDPEA